MSQVSVFSLKPRDYQGKRVNPPYRSSKVIPLKLFLDIVPSSSSDITRALRARSVYVLFRFVSKQTKTPNAMEIFSLIF